MKSRYVVALVAALQLSAALYARRTGWLVSAAGLPVVGRIRTRKRLPPDLVMTFTTAPWTLPYSTDAPTDWICSS